jgi:hypothetical protein
MTVSHAQRVPVGQEHGGHGLAQASRLHQRRSSVPIGDRRLGSHRCQAEGSYPHLHGRFLVHWLAFEAFYIIAVYEEIDPITILPVTAYEVVEISSSRRTKNRDGFLLWLRIT